MSRRDKRGVESWSLMRFVTQSGRRWSYTTARSSQRVGRRRAIGLRVRVGKLTRSGSAVRWQALRSSRQTPSSFHESTFAILSLYLYRSDISHPQNHHTFKT